MADQPKVSKKEIAKQARAYIKQTGNVSGRQLERIVREEVEQTVKQAKAIGREVLD